jgi:uncharacterized protein YjbI with pentapeptide repeats
MMSETNADKFTDGKNIRKRFSGQAVAAMLKESRVLALRSARLDGIYAGFDFRKADLAFSELSGDFQNSEFEGANLFGCVLSGCFNGARGLGPSLETCEIAPAATFHGADLRGATALIRNSAQVQNAVVGYDDPVDVLLDRTIQTRGRSYQLCLPAQVLKEVVVAGSNSAPAQSEQRPLNLRRISRPPQGNNKTSIKSLYDLSAQVGDLRWETNGTANSNSHPSLAFHLNAPGVTFTEIRTVAGQGPVTLVGNFDDARFNGCDLPLLELYEGTFNDLDLTKSTIKHVSLNMDRIDTADLQFPLVLEGVDFFWWVNERLNSFRIGVGYAPHVLAGWNNANQCEGLARHLLNHVKVITPAVALKMRNSTARTIAGVSRVAGSCHGDVIAVSGLIARRNQLLNPTQGRRSHPTTAPSRTASQSATVGNSQSHPSDEEPRSPIDSQGNDTQGMEPDGPQTA